MKDLERIGDAFLILQTYSQLQTKKPGIANDEIERHLTSLLIDLEILADRLDLDWDEIVANAKAHAALGF